MWEVWEVSEVSELSEVSEGNVSSRSSLPNPEGWPASALCDSELVLPLQNE